MIFLAVAYGLAISSDVRDGAGGLRRGDGDREADPNSNQSTRDGRDKRKKRVELRRWRCTYKVHSRSV